MALKYFLFTFCLLLSACGTSRYPNLHTVPDHLDITDKKSSCSADQQELEAIECT